ncbi:ribonuclease H family protein [Thalassotalea sp. SU-HH00458]|uniref:ribonuclease H family protein n=1 Tax=Thalassotalea sp. SU-HH00458 TaxID=3127657 RepID=UPI00310923EF
MAKKYYVVWKGAKTGVFDNWGTVQSVTAGRSDAQFMGFPSQAEAKAAFAESYTKALMKRSLSKGGSSPATSKPASNKPTVNKSLSSSRNVSNDADINIYCDGACSPNPGKSGTGIAVYQQTTLTELWYGLYEANGTNNTAELNGMLEAFKLAKTFIQQGKSVQVLSDSKYSIDCITKWAAGWKNKGWKKADGQPIKNPELVQACYSLYQEIKNNIIIKHVKGHANIEGNELSDRMAVLGRMKQETKFLKFTGNLDIKAILAMPSG